jgi:thiol-disulfide isomerase/thioredoxin
MTPTKNLICLMVAAATVFTSASLRAQTTTTTDTNTNAPLSTQAQLQKLVLEVQAKAQEGKHTEADYSDVLKTLDIMIADKKSARTDEAVQMTYMKAMLYLEVIRDNDKGAAILKGIATNYPNTEYSRSAEKILADITKVAAAQKIQDGLTAGTSFPDFATTNIYGLPLSVGALKGHVVLVDFWATWCPPCRAELPNVIANYKKHHGEGFDIIGVSLDDDREALDAFLKGQDGMTWPQYFDGQRWTNNLAVKYGVTSIPFTVLVGRDGKIVGKDLRGDDLSDAVTKALAAK